MARGKPRVSLRKPSKGRKRGGNEAGTGQNSKGGEWGKYPAQVFVITNHKAALAIQVSVLHTLQRNLSTVDTLGTWYTFLYIIERCPHFKGK